MGIFSMLFGRRSRPASCIRLRADLPRGIPEGTSAEIAAFLHGQDFTLIEAPGDSAGGGTAALTSEVDGCPVLLGFTSQDRAEAFLEAMPEVRQVVGDGDGRVTTFVVAGADFLAHLPEGFGILLDPESEECAFLGPDLVDQVRAQGPPQAEGEAQPPEQRAAGPAPNQAAEAESIRGQSRELLESLGYRVAPGLPLPEPGLELRPTPEIAARLMALGALVVWVTAPESAFAAEVVQRYIERNGLRDHLTDEERAILDLPRPEAQGVHRDMIGWKLENLWPLAWVLGFEPAPTVEAAEIDPTLARELIAVFLGDLSGATDELLCKARPRPAAEVIRHEDRFYCGHNAVRSAQLGERTVPEGFDPVAQGGVVHERRHALTWCLSPGVSWDDTDLST